MATFSIKRKNKMLKKIIISLIAVAFVAFVLWGLNAENASTVNSEEKSLNRAIERAVVNCYAENGFYPPSLSYLEENYNIVYDHSIFFIDYRPIATNIYPAYTIINKLQ